MGPIETKRLLLREFHEGDENDIFNNWASDKRVTEFLTWAPHASVFDSKAILSKWLDEYKKEDTYRLGIVLKEENKLIGAIDIVGQRYDCPEIGYCLAYDYWGKGIMTEAAAAFRDALFALGYRRLVIRARASNVRSTKVIFKLGGKFYEGDYDYVEKDDRSYLINTFFIDNPNYPPLPLPNPYRCH